MATNIGIGIANAIGFNRQWARGNILPKPIAAWSAAGKTNEDEDRAVLKDLTGNGHDITLNGFAFSEMSGYGGYAQNYNIIGNSNSIEYKNSNKLVINRTDSNTWFGTMLTSNYNNIEYKLLIDLSDYQGTSLYLIIRGSDGARNAVLLQNGINNIPILDLLETDTYISFSLPKLGRVTIEQVPFYESALVFDGVDDYGICENMPQVSDYTFIIKRKLLSEKSQMVSIFGTGKLSDSKLNYMWFEYRNKENGNDFFVTDSFGASLDIKNKVPDLISYQTKESYNGYTIGKGNLKEKGTVFKLGDDYYYFANMAFYSAYLFDRSLTEEEIKTFIRKNIDPSYLLPSEIPTPDCYYDFSLGSNDDANKTIVADQSGNGNDAKIYNCDFNEDGSGYKDGALVLDGVDDYVALEAFDSGFKTVFMLCNPFNNGIIYEQRKVGFENLCISNLGVSVKAYTNRNYPQTITMINGIVNTSVKHGDLINKKHLICIFNEDVPLSDSLAPLIGTVNGKNSYFSKVSVYKFLGFKEALNEDQIKAVIQKYNLLDGVDDIQVS